MSQYTGRFAPTPSGPLHLGSLLAAVGSYCAARHAGGQWMLRMDDLDTLRNAPGADQQILRCLEAYGLHWDGEVVYQSQHLEEYQAALQGLIDSGQTYPCACTRKILGNGPYPGTCAAGLRDGQSARSLRVRVADRAISFLDGLQGPQSCELASESGDFILRRADQVISYHLATVVDDARQSVSHVVRGADLLSSTAKHIFLQQLLGLSSPEYSHLPVICGIDGRKFSKQNHALILSTENTTETLCGVLGLLGQPTDEYNDLQATELLRHAVQNWRPENLPKRQEIRLASKSKA